MIALPCAPASKLVLEMPSSLRLSPYPVFSFFNSMANEPAVTLKDLIVIDRENLPSSGNCLILPSQLGYTDLLRLELLLEDQTLLYLLEEGAVLDPQVRSYLNSEDVQSICFKRDADASSFQKAIADAAKGGKTIVYVPGVAATVPAPQTAIPGTTLELLLQAPVPVVPIHILHHRDMALAVEQISGHGTTFMAVGETLDGDKKTLADYQQVLFGLSEKTVAALPGLNLHLGYALVLGLKKHGSRQLLVDGKDGKELRFDRIFTAAAALSKVIRKETQKPRIGVILPPGAGGMIANIAAFMAGKTPVNLNFTAGRASIESAMRQADLDRFLTADVFVRKMQSFPWPPNKQLVLIERLLPGLKTQMAKWLLLSKILPGGLLARMLGVPKKGGHKEALLLFTSGSSGEPKGVVLTHTNLLANVAQFGNRLQMKSEDSILGSLPLFHSFGCTVTLWYPIIQGINLVTYPSPIETKKIAELIERHAVSLMIATPTFLRGYLRGVNREQLRSIKMCVTGAEKLPATVAEAFLDKFGKRVLEGYGLTETSPVTNVNLPDPVPLGDDDSGHAWLPANRMGSVGQLVPGLAVKITHPETGKPQSLHESGIIWFKGPSVFDGYHNDPKRTADVIEEGWFRTGDIGRLDSDGFLYIEGRLSRFSKIAGEMVPHETVEENLVKALNLENESQRRIAIVGVPDPSKGEALVLISSLPGGPEAQEILDLRYQLLERGVPSLWIPRKMIRVDEIPVLASGKLDVRACQDIAKDAA